MQTPNLGLPLNFLGMIPFRKQIAKAFNILDDAVGGVADVTVVGAAPDADLAAKLAAMEARIVALEGA